MRLLCGFAVCAGAFACSAPNRSDSNDAAVQAQTQVPTQATPAASGEPPYRLTASIRELMDSEVDPAADFLWASVASISTRAGLEERQPHTDEEWLEVRRHAITLIEATNLLIMKGRRVSATYVPAGGAGELDSNQAQQKIDANHDAFVLLAQRLQETGTDTLGAIDAKDPVRLFDLGGAIDEACENCHVTFWYPNLGVTYK